jgi:hypothetical protein
VRPRGGQQPLDAFVKDLGLPDGFAEREPKTGEAFAAAVDFLENERPRTQNHWPALGLAFIAQAEKLLAHVGAESIDDIFATYPPVQTAPGGAVVNTFNIRIGDDEFKLRPSYNQALEVIRVEMRRQHPSNPAHATQSWPAYRSLITAIYSATPEERLALAQRIWATGVLDASERLMATAAARVVRPFEYILDKFPTQGATPGGALFQALVFGYFRADSPGLTLESHSVNTGSSRADMIGDVAGYRGGEVELAIEVKDLDVGEDDVEALLGEFLEDLINAPNATAVVACQAITDPARTQLSDRNVIALSRLDLIARVTTWDLPKQQEAIRGAAYFLSRIQKNPRLLERLTTFIAVHDLDGGLVGDVTITVPAVPADKPH